MAMITSVLLTALRIAFRSEFQKALTETPSDYDKIATVVPSTSASNTYGWLGQCGGPGRLDSHRGGIS